MTDHPDPFPRHADTVPLGDAAPTAASGSAPSDAAPSGVVVERTPVAIVGGGPVGMSLAIGLAQRGIACTVIERHPTVQQVPKGQNLTQRTMEHFRTWGIEPRLRTARTMDPSQTATGMTAYGTLLGAHQHPWLMRDRVRAYYAADNERLPQYRTEAVLRERAAELPLVTLRYGWTAEDVVPAEDGVTVRARSRDGAQLVIEAEYAVGCDGSRSLVREAAGISQTRTDHDRLMVLAVFRSTDFDRLMERFPGVAFVNVLSPELEGYWQFFGRVDAAETWFFHAPVDPASTAETLDLHAVLTRAIGAEIEFTVEHLGFWDLRFALADEYRRGRCLVAGDAAHSHPPYGGYGINTGFEDGANLAWKLAAELQGWAGPGLLDSYDEERRPVFASTRDAFIDRSIREDRAFLDRHDPDADPDAFAAAWAERETGAQSEVASYAPNYAGSSLVADGEEPGGPGPGAVGTHDLRARPGHHLAPQRTASGDEVFASLGTGFTLLTVDEAAAAPFARAAAERGVPFSMVLLGSEAAAQYGALQILVRPDQFVAWAGYAAAVDADDVLAAAVGDVLPLRAGADDAGA